MIKIGGKSSDTFELHLDLPAETSADENQLANLPIVAPYFEDLHLKSQMNGQITANGPLAMPELHARLSLSQTRWLDTPIPNSKLKLDLVRGELESYFDLGHSELTAQLKTNIESPQLDYTLDVISNEFDVRSLTTANLARDPRNFAYLSSKLNLSGNFRNFWTSAKGEFKITELRSRFVRDARAQSAVLDFYLAEDVTFKGENGNWALHGRSDIELMATNSRILLKPKSLHFPDRLLVDISGQLDLSVLKDIVPQLETAVGHLKINGTYGGSLSTPTYDIRIYNERNDPIAIGFSEIRPAFTNAQIDMRLVNQKLVINGFSAEKGRGRLNASGQLVFDERSGESSRLDLNFQNASFVSQVSVLKTFESELSGNLSVTGHSFPLLVAGDVKVVRARSNRNFDLREEIVNTLRRRNIETASSIQPKDPLLRFDIRIDADSSVAVSNRNLKTVLSANLNLAGTEVVPNLTGQIEVDQGVFAYKYQRDFRVTQGVITFDDPVRLDPRIDILSVAETSGYRVFMTITGRASDPRVDLSIDPPSREDGTPLTKVDILVLLSTGSLPSRERQNIATEDAAKAEALNVFVGQLEAPVEKIFDMSGQTIVQKVYIDSYAGPDGRPTARLNLPLNLHEDWDVIFRVDNTTQKLSAGYNIDKGVSVSGSIDRQNKDETVRQSTQRDPTDTGVDLKFRFAFP